MPMDNGGGAQLAYAYWGGAQLANNTCDSAPAYCT